MNVWITTEPWPASAEVAAAAESAGADVIWHGIPVAQSDRIPAGTVGLFTVPDVISEPPTVDPLHQLAQAIVDATTLDDVKPVALAILTDGDTP